jgi:hypothetical protein
LLDSATPSVRVASDSEQGVNTTVWCSIGISFESVLTNRSIEREKRRNCVPGTHLGRDRYLRIDWGAGTSHCGEGMAAATTIEVESWTESFGNIVNLAIGGKSRIERSKFRTCEAG